MSLMTTGRPLRWQQSFPHFSIQHFFGGEEMAEINLNELFAENGQSCFTSALIKTEEFKF